MRGARPISARVLVLSDPRASAAGAADAAACRAPQACAGGGRAVQVDPGLVSILLQCDVPLSEFAFNFNLRRYTAALEFVAKCVAHATAVIARRNAPLTGAPLLVAAACFDPPVG